MADVNRQLAALDRYWELLDAAGVAEQQGKWHTANQLRDQAERARREADEAS